MLIETFCSGPADTNTYLLGCEHTKKAAIIDAPPGSAKWLLKKIEEHSLVPEKILLTHSHWDHTADAALLKEKLNIPLLVHKEDAGNVEKPGSDGLPLFFKITPAHIDHFLEEGQKIQVGELTIQVIHTPGHTPGGVCFYLAQEHTLFSGDTLFQGNIGNLSFSTARPELMWTSLQKLADLPKETQVYPGHGDPTTIADEQWIRQAKQALNM